MNEYIHNYKDGKLEILAREIDDNGGYIDCVNRNSMLMQQIGYGIRRQQMKD